jgi:hypothetical protein
MVCKRTVGRGIGTCHPFAVKDTLMPTDRNESLEPNANAPQEILADGRYAVWRKIASGAQADTLEAVDRRNGRPVAIKRFIVSQAKSWKDVDLAEREARVLASLNHPSLPAYVDHFEERGALYLVMELVEGENLATRLRSGKRLGLADLRGLIGTLADILDYLHSRVPPVIHRDIKPANIILRNDGGFSLVDFGSVRDGLRPEGGSTVVGTFGYMAPEQFQGRALPASDVYAVGALNLALLTGKGPDELPHQGLAIDVEASLGGAIPSNWVQALRQMVSIDPDQRPSSLRSVLPVLDGPNESGGTSFADSRAAPPYADPEIGGEPDSTFTVMVGSGLGMVPWVLLTLARIALWLALGVVVPGVLYALSLFFGRALRHAARRVSLAGRAARAQLANLSGHIQRAEPFVLQGRRYKRRHRGRYAWSVDQHAEAQRRRVRIEAPGFMYDSMPDSETAGRIRSKFRRGGALFRESEGSSRADNAKKKGS